MSACATEIAVPIAHTAKRQLIPNDRDWLLPTRPPYRPQVPEHLGIADGLASTVRLVSFSTDGRAPARSLQAQLVNGTHRRKRVEV